LWHANTGGLELVAGTPSESDESVPNLPTSAHRDPRLLDVPGVPDYYLEHDAPEGWDPAELGRVVSEVLLSERDVLKVAQQLASRYEEIDLLYTIADVLGRTIDLKEAANVIVREVSAVVGARRASILVHDPQAEELQVVAGWGVDVSDFGPVPVADETSVAAKVFRDCEAILRATPPAADTDDSGPAARHYRGAAFLSVPIVYPDSHGVARPVGVINLTDRVEQDVFTEAHAKLVSAIAPQIGAAIENVRLIALDQQRQRVRHELELAKDLQLKLLPAPDVLEGAVDVGARCRSAQSVGGDFYNFVRLPGGRVGIMLGDVSTHGFSAALIMALVLSASAIHAVAADSPENALDRLLDSVRSELDETEMYLSLFYGTADSERGRLQYANAGHPHAFRVSRGVRPERLEATAPPLGLGDAGVTAGAVVPWNAGDLLVLFSDGITEGQNAAGESFGEARLLEIVRANHGEPAAAIVEAVFAQVDAFCESQKDDQTVVVLKA
jgi:sigma-B regulation protein RsbU (phosphoserine phosphatase)